MKSAKVTRDSVESGVKPAGEEPQPIISGLSEEDAESVFVCGKVLGIIVSFLS